MSETYSIPQELITSALLHFEQGVPISDCACRSQQKERLARVSHVYWLWVKNPWLDTFAMFKQLVKGKGADASSDWQIAQRDKILLDFIIDRVSSPSRRVSEHKVRVTADRLMQMGAETDNGRDMAEGAKILMKLDRLDQPESEQADMSKVMFLPPVVTTSAKEVDETKEDMDDIEMKRIMNKYNAYVDDKEKDIDKMVEVMAAKSQANAIAEEAGRHFDNDDNTHE